MTGAPREAAIDRLFAAWDDARMPGAVVGVALGGREIHTAGYGMADLAQGVALDRRSVIRIGSQTKQFCVLLALMLQAEGKLALDDEARDHAPWLPRFAERVTLRHLVTNTSGLRDFLGLLPLNGVPLAAPSTRADSRALIGAHAELNFAPGSQLLYSNSGFFILSEILEAKTDRSFDDLLQERICRPLGMRDTRLMAWDSEIHLRLAMHHTRGVGGDWRRAHWGFPLGGEGGMVSTLDDLRVWVENLKRPVIGAPEMYAELARPAIFTNGAASPYAHGLINQIYRGARTIGHSGGVAGGKSDTSRFPEHDLDVVILANLDAIAPLSLSRRIADVVLGDRLARLDDPADASRLAAAGGIYREEDGEDVFVLVASGNECAFHTSLGASPVRQFAPNWFAPEKGANPLVLSPAGDGTLAALSSGLQRRYRRVRPEARCGGTIAGRWRSEFGIAAAIEQDGDAARIRLSSDFGATTWPLAWIAPDLLMADAGGPAARFEDGRAYAFVLRVERDALVLSTERVRGLRLRRGS
jgi:CubicO group peptidase (beta-lactamase class C family)